MRQSVKYTVLAAGIAMAAVLGSTALQAQDKGAAAKKGAPAGEQFFPVLMGMLTI